VSDSAPWEDYSKPASDGPWSEFAGAKATPAAPSQPSASDLIAHLPTTVINQIKSGDMSALTQPGVLPIAMAALRDHPTLAKMAGATAGTAAGALTAGPLGAVGGAIAGGAAGASLADTGSQMAQAGTEEAPQTSGEALSRSGGAAAEGAAQGAMTAGGVAGAPPILRAIASKTGVPLTVGALTLAKTGDPIAAAKAAATAAVIGKGSGVVAPFLERLALKARLAHAVQAEAPAVVKDFAENVLPFRASSTGVPTQAPIIPSIPSGKASVALPAALESAPAAAAGPAYAPNIPAKAYPLIESPNRAMATNLGGKMGPKEAVSTAPMEEQLKAAIEYAKANPRVPLPNQPPLRFPGPNRPEESIWFGKQNPPGAPQEDLEAQLRASIEAAKANPRVPTTPTPLAPLPRPGGAPAGPQPAHQALATELETKVQEWRQAGLSKDQMASAMRDLYGVGRGKEYGTMSTAKKMIGMIMKTYGLE
jgi:hypothetical protein